MSPLAVSGIIFVCGFAAALIGLLSRPRLPEHHLNPESKELVKLVIGVIGTMTALVLGLLVASAKSSYDAQRGGVSQMAANVVMLDRALALYGKQSQGTPESAKTQEVRELLRASVADLLRRTWRQEHTAEQSGGSYEEVFERVLALEPKTDPQKTLHAQALRILIETGQLRSNLTAQQQASSIPSTFLVVMVVWMALTLGGFGLLAPRNATTVVSLALCAVVVSSSLLLVLELDHPFDGMIQISSQPLRSALEHLGQ